VVPKEQPPRKLSGHRDRLRNELWRDPGQIRGAEGIAISGSKDRGGIEVCRVNLRETWMPDPFAQMDRTGRDNGTDAHV